MPSNAPLGVEHWQPENPEKAGSERSCAEGDFGLYMALRVLALSRG